METEKTAPESQDTPQEQLLAGKFKSSQELESAYQEAVRSQSQLSEENDRMQRYIALMDQPPASRAPEAQTPTEEQTEEEVPPAVRNYVSRAVGEAQRQVKQSYELEQRFFEAHPDLRGHEDLVIFHTMKMRQEGKRLSLDQAIDEVAKRTRAHIERIRGQGRTPPHVEGGSRGGAPLGRQAPEEPPSEPQRLADYIAEGQKRKTKSLGKG